MEEIEKLKKYLEESRKDCLKQKEKNDLTPEGEGMLVLIDAIYEEMGWGG